MGINLTIQLSYKFRLLLLFALCTLLIGWVTSSYLVAAIQEIPKPKIFNRTIIWRKELASSNKASVTKSMLEKCPRFSPYLRGTSKLIFKSNLTWEEVLTENPKVQKGRYHPDCKALQRVAIIIPHRNREKHLLYLLKHLHPFLQRQQVDYGIYVVHQAGDGKFNRARLLNVGYLEALKEENWDCFIFHDVDLIPENDYNLYTCDIHHPKHLVVGRNSTGYRLRYKGYFGGVSALTKDQFYIVNGFSNNYWGWGGEDDDLRIRVEIEGMKISRPPPSVAKYTMIFHTRDKGNEENKERMKLLNLVPRVWKTDGLNTCSYNLQSVTHNPLYINITVDFLSLHNPVL